MPTDLLDPRYGPTIDAGTFFARRHERDPDLGEAYEAISRQRRLELDRRGEESTTFDEAREAAARRIATGAYQAFLHSPETGDAVDLGDGATLVIGRSGVDAETARASWPRWLLLGGVVGIGLLQLLAGSLARRPRELAGDRGGGDATRP